MTRPLGLAAGIALVGLLALGRSAWVPQVEPIRWLGDEAEAKAESQRTGMPLLVDAWAEWCAACKLLDRHTWSDPRVQRKVREGFVPLRLNLSAVGPATDAQMLAYRVDELPTVIACLPRACAAGSAPRVTGYLPPDEMLGFLNSRH